VLILGLIALKAKSDRDGTEPEAGATAKGPASAGRVNARSLDTLWFVTVVYAVVYWLAAPEITQWGIHWGNRYLLVLYPLLAIPCAVNLARWRASFPSRPRWGVPALRIILGVVVFASFAAQIWSITILDRKMDFSSRLNREVESRPEQAIVGTGWWIGQELYGVFDRTTIFYAASQGQFAVLARMLASKGYSTALAVVPAVSGPSFYPPGGVRVQTVSDNGLGYWTVDLLTVNLSPGRR